MWILCPEYGTWDQLLPCGVRRATSQAEAQLGHLAGWMPHQFLPKKPRPIASPTVLCPSPTSVGFLCWLKAWNQLLLHVGFISQDSPLEKEVRGATVSVARHVPFTLSPGACWLIVQGQVRQFTESYVLMLLSWAGRGCQGKHIPLYLGWKTNNISHCLCGKANISTIHGDAWRRPKLCKVICCFCNWTTCPPSGSVLTSIHWSALRPSGNSSFARLNWLILFQS